MIKACRKEDEDPRLNHELPLTEEFQQCGEDRSQTAKGEKKVGGGKERATSLNHGGGGGGGGINIAKLFYCVTGVTQNINATLNNNFLQKSPNSPLTIY